jgi:hypothetical protein
MKVPYEKTHRLFIIKLISILIIFTFSMFLSSEKCTVLTSKNGPHSNLAH